MGTSSSRSDINSSRGGAWSDAKRRTTSFIRETGSSARSALESFALAVRYDEIKSGARGGGGRLSTSVKAGQGLGSFFGDVISGGLDQALRSAGLGNLIGASPSTVLSALVDYICGDGSLLNDVVARSAAVEVLAEIFDENDETYDDLRERWDIHLDKDLITKLLSLFLAQSIFQIFLIELGSKFEGNNLSAKEAAQKEKEIYELLKEIIKFDLGKIDPLKFNWKGRQGQLLIKRNLDLAISQL